MALSTQTDMKHETDTSSARLVPSDIASTPSKFSNMAVLESSRQREGKY